MKIIQISKTFGDKCPREGIDEQYKMKDFSTTLVASVDSDTEDVDACGVTLFSKARAQTARDIVTVLAEQEGYDATVDAAAHGATEPPGRDYTEHPERTRQREPCAPSSCGVGAAQGEPEIKVWFN